MPESICKSPGIQEALKGVLKGVSSHILNLWVQFENEESDMSSYL